MGYQTNRNCTQYKNGVCLHQAAPRAWFGRTLCLLDWPSSDPRIPRGCNLQVEHARSKGPLPPAPSRKSPSVEI